MKRSTGFTLIEVLIALAIVAISLTAALLAISTNLQNQTRLNERIIGFYVTQNAIEMLAFTARHQGKPQKSYESDLFNKKWYWQTNTIKTSCENVNKITIKLLDKQYNANILSTTSTYVYQQNQ